MTIIEVLQEIRSDRLKSSIDNLRLLYEKDSESYGAEKLLLPAVTFCGTFEGARQKDKVKTYNHLVVLDIDKLSTTELARIRAVLERDEYAFSFWSSPSNHGIKGLVSLKFDFDITLDNRDHAHKSAFAKLSSYYWDKYEIELDGSGSDTTRLCFLSYDICLTLKDSSIPFEITLADLTTQPQSKTRQLERAVHGTNKKDSLYNPAGKNKSSDRYAIKTLIKYLTAKNISITSEFENWYRVAYAISNTFTYDIGLRYYLELCRLDGTKHDEVKSTNMLTYCYENSKGGLKYRTIEYLAKQKGYINKNLGEGAFRNGV